MHYPHEALSHAPRSQIHRKDNTRDTNPTLFSKKVDSEVTPARAVLRMAASYFRFPLNELRFFRRGGADDSETAEIDVKHVVSRGQMGIEVFSGEQNLTCERNAQPYTCLERS